MMVKPDENFSAASGVKTISHHFNSTPSGHFLPEPATSPRSVQKPSVFRIIRHYSA